LHTAVNDVRTTKTLRDKTAKGVFYVVKVKVSSNVVKAKLGLTTLGANVSDDQHRHFHRDWDAESMLPAQPDFEKMIGPNENFEKEIVFDIPTDAANPRLDLREGFGIDHMIEAVLIGDEDSILHKRTLFKLTEQNQVAGVK